MQLHGDKTRTKENFTEVKKMKNDTTYRAMK